MPVEAAERETARFPEKTDLILLTDRPPSCKPQLKYFTQDLTPNEAFFVRWHLADVPTKVDTQDFSPDDQRPRRAGAGSLSLDDPERAI